MTVVVEDVLGHCDVVLCKILVIVIISGLHTFYLIVPLGDEE